MLKALPKFLQRFLSSSSDQHSGDSRSDVIVPEGSHPITLDHLSPNALKVLNGLHKHGYQACLVGGCIRDILAGNKPKDFDVATNATPEEIKRVFSNCRIIGRRFRLAHVHFGRDIIEVATFRGHHTEEEQNNTVGKDRKQRSITASAHSQQGMILRDNVYGSIEDDAIRRDFTINALYFDIGNHSVYNFSEGIEDIAKKRIALIGDPETRFREDPVRMLRAARFAAKLTFQLTPETEEPIDRLRHLLHTIPPARLFDETLKLLLSGYAADTLPILFHYKLFDLLFPATAELLNDNKDKDMWMRFFQQAALNTDTRLARGQRITPAFILGVMLWPVVKAEMEKLQKEQQLSFIPALHTASQSVLSAQQKTASIPKRFSMTMRDIWELQLRLPNRRGKKAEQSLHNQRFRAGYDFLLLREQAGEIESGLGEWWTEYQDAGDSQRRTMVASVSDGGPKGGKRRRSNRRKPRRNDSPQ